MNKREDRIVVEFDEDNIKILCEWKKLSLGLYGTGGIKRRVQELILEDCKKLKNGK